MFDYLATASGHQKRWPSSVNPMNVHVHLLLDTGMCMTYVAGVAARSRIGYRTVVLVRSDAYVVKQYCDTNYAVETLGHYSNDAVERPRQTGDVGGL